MPIENWNMRDDGNIAVERLLGWEAASAPLTGLLRLETASVGEQSPSGARKGLQIEMTVGQMQQLAKVLQELAKRVETKASTTRQ